MISTTSPRAALLSLTLMGLLSPQPARAELLRGPYDSPSPIALEGQVGFLAGLGSFTPGGFYLAFDYSHRFARYQQGRLGLGFFGNLGFIIGSSGGACPRDGSYFDCSSIGYGSGLLLKAGLQLTFKTPIPLVPYVRGGLGVAGAFARDSCQDSGGGIPILVVGGGARYHFTQHLSAGLASDLSLGPMFYSSGRCSSYSHTELWRAISLVAGVQYTL